MGIFADEQEMQESALRLAGRLRRVEVTPDEQASFIKGQSIPLPYREHINRELANFSQAHHYVVISYTRLLLTGKYRL